MSPARIVPAAGAAYSDVLADAFTFEQNPDGPEGLPKGRWWIATCRICGLAYDARSSVEETIALKLQDRNALLAHAKQAHSDKSLQRRK